ncbi:ArsR family transcriptional regulator [Shigella flexneri]|nr:ArsR family transcriptional regulator [Shigella flexneri]EHF1099865.1 ArsR family transcriptional regulator [Shigella flexneri]
MQGASLGISLNHGVHAKVSTPVHLRKARTCYDHLAGEVAVKIYDSLCQQQWITENGSMITLSGIQYFHEMGIDVPSKHSRKICCACLDWSERRFHLGGYVGAALFSLYESKGWLTRHLGYREVTITEKGYAAFKTHFHI